MIKYAIIKLTNSWTHPFKYNSQNILLNKNIFLYPEEGPVVWLVRWAQAVGLRGECPGWAEGPQDAHQEWALVHPGETEAAGETGVAYWSLLLGEEGSGRWKLRKIISRVENQLRVNVRGML